MPWRRALVRRIAGRATLAAALLALVLSTGLVPVRPATTAAAGTAETMEGELLASINAARIAQGLVPYRMHAGLASVAGDRAAAMAAASTLSHSVAGCLSCQLASHGIPWFASGEDIGESGWPWGNQAATSLFDAWKGSPVHWDLMMSANFNYVGIGVAYNATTGTTWSSIVMTESIDQTRPWARMAGKSVSGTTAAWSWKGGDIALQTHTAGLKNFDVQYRVDSDLWKTIRSATTSTSLILTGRPHGHYYGVRVRARDRVGNLSSWTSELRVWVP